MFVPNSVLGILPKLSCHRKKKSWRCVICLCLLLLPSKGYTYAWFCWLISTYIRCKITLFATISIFSFYFISLVKKYFCPVHWSDNKRYIYLLLLLFCVTPDKRCQSQLYGRSIYLSFIVLPNTHSSNRPNPPPYSSRPILPLTTTICLDFILEPC